MVAPEEATRALAAVPRLKLRRLLAAALRRHGQGRVTRSLCRRVELLKDHHVAVSLLCANLHLLLFNYFSHHSLTHCDSEVDVLAASGGPCRRVCALGRRGSGSSGG